MRVKQIVSCTEHIIAVQQVLYYIVKAPEQGDFSVGIVLPPTLFFGVIWVKMETKTHLFLTNSFLRVQDEYSYTD